MQTVSLLIQVLACCAALACAEAVGDWQSYVREAPVGVRAADDFTVVPFGARSSSADVTLKSYTSKLKDGRSFTGHAFTSPDPRYFSFAITPDGCSDHKYTSVTSKAIGCVSATNAGFFAFTPPACESTLISNGKTFQPPTSAAQAYFGISAAKQAVVIGFMTPGTIQSLNFTQLSSGRGWLVRDGASNVDHSPDLNPNSSFVTEKAPRTAVGVTKAGELVQFVADGVEETKEGLGLFEFAEALVDFGLYHAINLDGGGSSDAVQGSKVVSQPTCNDSPTICERNVTSITCVMPHPLL